MAVSIIKAPSNVNFPSDEIGMTFVHLHVPLSASAPFRILDSARTLLTSSWQNSLSAAFDPLQGLPPSQFVVFPEFALPVEAVPQVEETLKSAVCPSNTIVISGIEWLDIAQYSNLLQNSANPEPIKSNCPAQGLYINPVIIWIKTADNILKRYVQPKLRPSRIESASQVMYCGEDVILFTSNGPEVFSFAVLICFDCIARDGQRPMFDQLLDGAPETAPDSSINWHMLLVPQYNDKPEHPEFLKFAASFLNLGGPTYNTADSAVAFVNASAPAHGRSIGGFGRSSIFYRAGRWQSIPEQGPLDVIPDTYALEKLNADLMRARFREDGPCLHRFSFLKPWTVLRESGSSRIPLLIARSRNINPDGTLDDWQHVPAMPKVFGDWLQEDLASTATAFKGRISIGDEYADVRKTLLTLKTSAPERLNQIMDLLLLGFQDPHRMPKVNPDLWQKRHHEWRDDDHGQAIVQLAATSSLLRLLDNVRFHEGFAFCSGTCGTFHFVIIDGWNHCRPDFLVQQYQEWLADNPIGQLVGRHIVLILARTTRVYLNTPNNTAELVTSHTDVASNRDEATLRSINPELISSPDSITSDTTKVFKHFASVLMQALEVYSKAQAVHFLRERLSNAI